MSETQTAPNVIVNVEHVEAIERTMGAHWGASFKPLTPSMRPAGGRLGVNQISLPPGRSTCPFHMHAREDEVFYVLSGRGVLRYGDTLRVLRAGDCVSCPAGMSVAHQIANPFDEDLVYLGIGLHDPHEVCVYPDSGKALIRSLNLGVGRLESTEYMDGEPETPRIFDLIDAKG